MGGMMIKNISGDWKHVKLTSEENSKIVKKILTFNAGLLKVLKESLKLSDTERQYLFKTVRKFYDDEVSMFIDAQTLNIDYFKEEVFIVNRQVNSRWKLQVVNSVEIEAIRKKVIQFNLGLIAKLNEKFSNFTAEERGMVFESCALWFKYEANEYINNKIY